MLDCTRLNLVCLRCLLAQDFILASPRMLNAQDLAWFTSDANCAGLNLGSASDADRIRLTLGSPRMLIAQDLLVSPRMLIAQDLILFFLRCWLAQDLILFALDASHRTCSGFASDADCTGLNLVSPQMLIA